MSNDTPSKRRGLSGPYCMSQQKPKYNLQTSSFVKSERKPEQHVGSVQHKSPKIIDQNQKICLPASLQGNNTHRVQINEVKLYTLSTEKNDVSSDGKKEPQLTQSHQVSCSKLESKKSPKSPQSNFVQADYMTQGMYSKKLAHQRLSQCSNKFEESGQQKKLDSNQNTPQEPLTEIYSTENNTKPTVQSPQPSFRKPVRTYFQARFKSKNPLLRGFEPKQAIIPIGVGLLDQQAKQAVKKPEATQSNAISKDLK